jgi:hypothetical protein
MTEHSPEMHPLASLESLTGGGALTVPLTGVTSGMSIRPESDISQGLQTLKG